MDTSDCICMAMASADLGFKALTVAVIVEAPFFGL
jgi:hypothetical protein